MNPYDVLNVRDNATKHDIDKAYAFYKQKYNAKDYSGDKLYAIKRMTDIDAAYRVLSNPQLRSAFDNRYNTHVKSHVSKKDAYKDYYVNDPIGTHEHHDFEMAMKKYESRKPLFDFQKSAIKTYGDEVFDNENIRDYSEFTSQKAQTTLKKFVIFMIIAYFACMFLLPVFSMFAGFSDLLNNMWDHFQLEKEQESYYDESTTQDINYGYPTDNSNDYDYNDYYDYNDTSSSTDDYYEVDNFISQSQLEHIYNNYYADEFDTFEEFKVYYNNLYVQYQKNN